MLDTDLDGIELPESVVEALREDSPDQEEGSGLNEQQLNTLCMTLIKKRTEYRDYRQNSGIEQIWQRNEEFYVGMDEANRHEFHHVRFHAPTTIDGPLVVDQAKQAATDLRCTLFPRVPARYVDAGTAKVCEIILPPDEVSFAYDATPVPSLLAMADSDKPVPHPAGSEFAGQAMERDARPDEQANMPPTPVTPADPSQPQQAPEKPGVPILERDFANEKMEKATKAAKKAQKRVEDWHVEAQFAQKMRRAIFDSARLGVGVIKGPIPTLRSAMAVTKDPVSGEVAVEFEEKLVPDYDWASPWDIFPSPSCGENVRNGEGLFHRDYLSRTGVEELAKKPGYIKRMMNQVIAEGPQKTKRDNTDPTKPDDETRYEIWYWYGSLSRDEWECIHDCADYPEGERPDPLPKDQTSVYVTVTLINDCLVYASRNALKSGTIPFYTFPWQDRPGSWAGMGVVEQTEAGVRIIVAATRALLDNAGVSAGSQIIMDADAVYPSDGQEVITKLKVWLKKPECDDVRKAFAAFTIPNVGPQLMADIEYGFRLVEESCNIPLISQGHSGKTLPETYGAAKLQDNNANQLLRGVASRVDDCINEPLGRADYEWLLLDPSVPAEEKGDFQVNARGSSALAERALQDEAAVEQLELVAVHGEKFGADPKRAYKQYLKAKRLNPSDFMFSEKELEQKSKQPPPKDPKVQVAEIKAQTDIKKVEVDQDRDTAFVQAQTEQNKIEFEARMQELAVKRELELLKYANDQKLTLMQVKADLAQTSLELTVQKQLSGLSDDLKNKTATPEVTTPPSEPAGRADIGRSYEQ